MDKWSHTIILLINSDNSTKGEAVISTKLNKLHHYPDALFLLCWLLASMLLSMCSAEILSIMTIVINAIVSGLRANMR